MDNQNLSEFECHFTWDFINLKKRTKLYLRDRINTIVKELSSQNEGLQRIKRNFPQLYSLLGYLYVQLYEKTEDRGQEFLTKAETSFNAALNKCKDENVGYRTVIYADFIHFEQKWGHGETTEFIKNYRDLSQDFVNHPEILAMKGYTASVFHSDVNAMKFYKGALSYKRTAEWVFGLALAMQQHNKDRTTKSEEIEKLLRETIQLDPTYDMARLKLAKQLWNNKETREENKEDIEHLIEGINTNQANTTLLVKKAALLCQIHPNTAQGETLLTKALGKYLNSHEILRGFGHVYFKRWNANKTDESNLDRAIEYFTKTVDTESQNAMHFDLTMIGCVHLEASKYYRYKYVSKHREHLEKCQKWMKKAEQRLSKEQYDLKDSINTSYRLSQYYKHKGELEKEKRYLRKTLSLANQGSEEDKFHELGSFKGAKYRLLKVTLNDGSDETEKLKTISWVYEQSYEFEKAIDHFQKAMSMCWDEAKLEDMYEREALLLSKQVEKEMKNDNESQSFDEFNQKVEELHDCETKWNLTLEIRIIKIEKSMSDDQNLRELKEKSLQFEVSLSDLHKCKVETEEWHIEENKMIKKVFAVVWNSKIILDHSVNYIREKLYPKGRSMINYPRPPELEGKNEKSRQDWIERYYKSNEWTNFSKKYATISNFLVEGLDVGKYKILINLIALRNYIAHKTEKDQIAFLNDKYPKLSDKIELVRKSSEYAVEVLKVIKREVDTAKQIKDNETDQSHANIVS